MPTIPVYHWTMKALKSPDRLERYILHIYDEAGTLQGYIQNNEDNDLEAFVGRPGSSIGLYDTVDDAKGAVLYCLTGEE